MVVFLIELSLVQCCFQCCCFRCFLLCFFVAEDVVVVLLGVVTIFVASVANFVS